MSKGKGGEGMERPGVSQTLDSTRALSSAVPFTFLSLMLLTVFFVDFPMIARWTVSASLGQGPKQVHQRTG